jgi:AMP deaminase
MQALAQAGPSGASQPFAASASLSDAKALRELLQLRTDLLKANIPGTEPYVGPMTEVAMNAMARLYQLMENPSLNRFCENHLRLNDLHYEGYELTEKRLEDVETRSDNTDFYMTAKCDTHLHLSALMTSPELLAYLNEIYARDGHMPYDAKQTIGEMILAAGFEPGKTAIDDLRTQSTADMYRDFDEFNAAFTPFRSKALADLLFKPQILGGRYLKEIISRMADKAQQSNIFLEPRVSVYARKYGEWAELGDWFETARPWHKHVLYAIQFPRVYHVWKKMKAINNFGELLNNFFGPMFEATLHPEKHENLAKLLKQIKCIDTVDNEAQDDPFFISEYPPATKYERDQNPPYSYYTFYFWHNLRALNAIRQDKGLNTFKFRPHAGEAGPPHHLASTFLFANGISHGINLEHQPVLQYLYYLADFPISVSPISNACLFLPYAKNPFPMMFKRGLRVTLTTDDPLQFHMSNQPLLEEYITAKHAWSLTMTDLSEIARNSVLISSARHELREELIGGPDPCDRCNVPKRRFDFRHDERARNNMIIGLPPPMYPVHGLERSDPSDKKLQAGENQQFAKKRALTKTESMINDSVMESAWRNSPRSAGGGDGKKPAKPAKPGLLASFFSSKTLRATFAASQFKKSIKVTPAK